MCIHKEQIYIYGNPSCIQATNDLARCRDGLSCFEQTNSDLADAVLETYEDGEISNNYQHEGCGEGWDMTYMTPPSNCHRVNTAMRDYLNHYNIEEADIDDICYVDHDQW